MTTTTSEHTIINLNHLSQSQLRTLCSQPTYDTVPLKLDYSLINLSSSSVRQTLPQRHRFKPHLHLTQSNSKPDLVTRSIVYYLKHFMNGNHNPPQMPIPITNNKRIRVYDKNKVKKVERLVRVDGKGEVVDFDELGKNGDDLIDEELVTRFGSEENVLRFLQNLDGEWGSTRRLTKYVDAEGFGGVLPVGWKLLIAVKNRGYRLSVYCSSYVSPTGEHFMSCGEVASFLKSYFGDAHADQQRDLKSCSIQQAYVASSTMNGSPAEKSDLVSFGKAAHSNERETDDHLVGIENLPEVKVRDSFECVKCTLTFEEKDVYFQHLLAYHQKTTKRYKFGMPVGEGVIIRDGKFECQFCHKVFNEKRSYSGHVGIHVRNTGKFSNDVSIAVSSNKDPEPPLHETLPSISPRVEVQSSIVETSNVGNIGHASTNQQTNVLKLEEPQIDCSNIEASLSSDPVAVQTEVLKLNSDANKSPSEHLNHISHAVIENNDMASNDYEWNTNMDSNCLNDGMDAGTRAIESYGNSNLEMGIGRNDHLEDTRGLNVRDMVFQDGVSTVPLTQSFDFFPSFDSASNKVEHDFSVVGQKLENVTGFEELRFDDIEPFKYGYMHELNGQDLPSLPGCSMNLENDGRIDEQVFNSSVRLLPQEVMLNTVDPSPLTVCVWCRTEFRLDGIELETPLESFGYMCPICKAKISEHFGGGGGPSMGSHAF